jgi:diguanylate cyclase (GGDEF)-like protein
VSSQLHCASGEHQVQFYENDAFLIEGLTDYIGAALTSCDTAVVIATHEHLAAVEKQLLHRGLLPPASSGSADKGNYVGIEAGHIMPQFMVNEMPDETLFIDVIGGIIENATGECGDKHVCVFGEMVAILCQTDWEKQHCYCRHDAAIAVENCFVRLMQQHHFSLLCGYPIDVFPREEDAEAFRHICALHTRVKPTEKFRHTGDIDSLNRTIAILQQKAYALTFEVSERQQLEQALRNAHFDRLTGLPNRAVFQDRLGMEIRIAHRTHSKLALLFIDLDHFKEINDTLGHDMGDILLKQVGHRLSESVREVDTVARLGGDEFTILLSKIESPEGVSHVAQNILHRLAEPFRIGNEFTYVSASIGITLWPQDADNVADLLKHADQAMYAAKSSGRNRAAWFTRSMQEAVQKRMKLANEMRTAIAKNQFHVLYQPIVSLQDNVICKAEALLRWRHPLLGLINPAEFIPIAEHTGLIVEIGEWIFRQAARRAAEWRRIVENFQVSVNVSPIQLQMDSENLHLWSKYLRSGKHHAEGAPMEITVEITEGLLLDASPVVLNKLLSLRDAGIQVSLDDFGTGYSSLSYLRKFDIDYLKIDQSFVRDLETKPDNLALCEAIIVMAHKLGLKVIAEGVESGGQCSLLSNAGCDYAQGFLFGRPLWPPQLEALLRMPPSHPAHAQ